MPRPDIVDRLLSREVVTFLAVGGTGYVVDVTAFNALRATSVIGSLDPSVARTLAVVVAMLVTYVGNRTWTWRGGRPGDRRREVALFVVFNAIGLGFSVGTLFVSHDLMGLTSPLADNLSANVVGLALGTAFRFVTYRRFVFGAGGPVPVSAPDLGSGSGRADAATTDGPDRVAA